MRENYQHDINGANTSLQSFKDTIRQQHAENKLLRQILIEHNISPEAELARKRNGSTLSPTTIPIPPEPASSMQNYHVITPTSAVSTRFSPTSTTPNSLQNGMSSSKATTFSMSPPTVASSYGHSPAEAGVSEQAAIKPDPGVSDLPIGVFESKPQLQVDFILK